MCVMSNANSAKPFPTGTRFAREAQAANSAHLTLGKT